MQPVDNFDLCRWRALDAIAVLAALGCYIKEDGTYVPTQAKTTRRFHVDVASHDFELLLTGPKYYDVRASEGGGGAIDLVMHLWRVPFKAAATMLRDAGL